MTQPSDDAVMRQEAPYPAVLRQLVDQLRYKAGWTFFLQHLDRGQGSKGLTLVIHIVGPDSYHPERQIAVNHYMLVPPAAYDVRSWRRWLFEQILLVERHEAMEFFQLDGDRPYAPSHGPGNDPYLVRELGTDIDQRTSFQGELTTACAHDSFHARSETVGLPNGGVGVLRIWCGGCDRLLWAATPALRLSGAEPR